jgi:uncharacterized protein YkwD
MYKSYSFKASYIIYFCFCFLTDSNIVARDSVKFSDLDFADEYVNNDKTKFSDIDFAEEYTGVEMELLHLTNMMRTEHKLQPLKLNWDLTLIAREQSTSMAKHRQLSHTVGGQTLEHRIKKSGYIYRTIGENVARSKNSPSHIVGLWMKSPAHRKNILNPQFKEVGFGVNEIKNGDRYYTQVFGLQR